MNVNKNKSLTSGGGGCGCGCGGGGNVSVTSGCSCDGRGCEACITNAFARPNFFAGQLLTEDDLQQLGDYVVAKNRLHNRFLFGEGVVCGLEVNCHPCGEGRVIVQPGYALDCCGNDLMLSCAKTLDILSMVRELRRKNLGGYDCGDPCEDVPPAPVPTPVPTPGRPIDTKNPAAVIVEEAPTNPLRHYCLYVRYCEEGTDPVAPYSTGESCGTTSCQTTRIREGVKFELRCQTPEHPRNDMLARLMASFDDLESFERIMRSAAYQRTFSSVNRQSLVALREGARPEFEVVHRGRMESAAKILNDSLKTVRPDIAAGAVRRSTAKSASTSTEPVSEVSVRNTLDAMLEANAITARFYAQDKETRKRLLAADKALPTKLRDAKAAISNAREVLTPELIEKSLTHPMEKEYALGLLEVGGTLVQDNPPENDMAIRMMADYGISKPGFSQASQATNESLRQWLLERLDRSPNLSDCQLRSELERLDFSVSPLAEIRETWNYNPSLDAYRRSDDRLIELFARYFRDAICSALNPTCAPCDDPAVLLACFELKDCEIVRICNLERSFVLSPAAMRYWLSPVTLLGEAFEKLCCTEIKFETDPKTIQDPKKLGLNQIMRTSRPSMERQLVAFIEEATGLDIRRIMRLGKPISALVSRPLFGTESGVTNVFGNFGAGRSATATTPSAPPAPAAESTAAPATAAPPPAPSAAIPFDLTSGVGLAVKERIESMIDARVEERVSALRKEFAVSPPAAPAVETPPAPPAAATPAAEEAKRSATGAAKPTKDKKKASKTKDTAAKEEDAAKDEEK